MFLKFQPVKGVKHTRRPFPPRRSIDSSSEFYHRARRSNPHPWFYPAYSFEWYYKSSRMRLLSARVLSFLVYHRLPLRGVGDDEVAPGATVSSADFRAPGCTRPRASR